MTESRITRLLTTAVLVIAVAFVAGCGKRGGLEPPPDKKEEYKYPRQYPR